MNQIAQSTGGPPPKEDPETLVLRGRPRPALRFRRGLVIGITGAVATAVVGLAWFALEPPTFRVVAEAEEGRPVREGSPDVLAEAPAGYGEVPRLGPPLPGDLGRPILEHQRRTEALGATEQAPLRDDATDQVRAAAESERQRQAAAELAARSSGVLVQLGRAETVSPEVRPAGGNPPGAPAAPPRSAQERRDAFVQPAPGSRGAAALVDASSPWTLSVGTVIPASLITGLNSDLPGLVLAQVTEHVRDSATGRTVLIPQGSRLVGRYDSSVAFAQRRALLVWDRLILPDGSSIELEKLPATDSSGQAGLEDRVDFHGGRLITGIVLSTLLGVGTELGLGSDEGELVRAVRESAQQNTARAGDQITQRNLNVAPTLRVRPGWPVRAIVNKDLVLRPWSD